jgi:hypothetical protein
MVMTKRSLGIVAWYVPFTETKALCSGIYPRLRKRVTLQMLVSRHVCWLVMSVFAFQYQEWNYMRGGLSTIDRDYGWFNNIHHDIGTHVVHHLFPQIPHYNLIEATEAIKPVLGEYYRDPKKSGPIPIHLVEPLLTSLKQDHYVSDSGDIVFYQTDPTFSISSPQHVSESTP